MPERIGEITPEFDPSGPKEGSQLQERPIPGAPLVLKAYEALQAGNEGKARRLYRRALRQNPGLGLIGELPPVPVKLGPGTVEDTRRAMLNAASWPKEPESDQSYYWTKGWQRDEREADQEILEGRTTKFPTVQEAIDHLKGLK